MENFTVRLNKRSKDWKMDLSFQVPVGRLPELVAYLCAFKPKEPTPKKK